MTSELRVPLSLQDDKAVDLFLIYGKRYADLRDSLIISREENNITGFQVCVYNAYYLVMYYMHTIAFK